MNGRVHIYTGDGKGKTTAAIGLIVRARGAGMRVYLGQFMKKGEYSEIKSMSDNMPYVKIEQYGTGHFVVGKPSREDIESARRGLDRMAMAVSSGDYDLVVADEVFAAVQCGLISNAELLDVVRRRRTDVELVMTGRGATAELTDMADLVTEMKAVKHYHDAGVGAREGIEF